MAHSCSYRIAGGALHGVFGGTVTVRAVNFVANSALQGGAMSLDGTSVSVSGSSLSYNTALDGNGGAMFIWRTPATTTTSIDQTTFAANSARGHGGALFAQSSSVSLAHARVENNTATGSAGGGIYGRAGSLMLVNSTVQVRTVAEVCVGCRTATTNSGGRAITQLGAEVSPVMGALLY